MRISDWSSDVCSSDLLSQPVLSQPLWIIGLMSGTSMDGIDAALLRTDGETIAGFGPALTLPYPETLRAQIRGCLGGQGPTAAVSRAQIGNASCRESGCPFV